MRFLRGSSDLTAVRTYSASGASQTISLTVDVPGTLYAYDIEAYTARLSNFGTSNGFGPPDKIRVDVELYLSMQLIERASGLFLLGTSTDTPFYESPAIMNATHQLFNNIELWPRGELRADFIITPSGVGGEFPADISTAVELGLFGNLKATS